jgi:D-glycero-alpha-D-manno-heptose 1-phosphate guanylyltransferase
MEAIILAGGFGTRLREVVSDVPKPMAPIAGKPFLQLLLDSLSEKGFTRVILSVGYMAETIVNHFGHAYKNIELVYEVEDSPLGTGGAVRAAMQHCNSDHVFVFNGDTFLDLEASEVEQLWQTSGLPIIVGRMVADTSRYGRLQTEHGLVTGFIEKGLSGPGLINAGCYILPTDALNHFTIGENFSLEEHFLMKVVSLDAYELFTTDGQFIDIGIPEDYSRAQTELVNAA